MIVFLSLIALFQKRKNTILFGIFLAVFSVIFVSTINLNNVLESDFYTRKVIFETYSKGMNFKTTDFFEHYIIEILSYFGLNWRVYFFVLICCFSFIQLILYRRLYNVVTNDVSYIPFITIFILIGFSNVGMFRFYFACLLFALGYFYKEKKSGVWLVLMTPLIHFSFLSVILIYFLSRLKLTTTIPFIFVLSIVASFSFELILQRIDEYTSEFFLDSYLEARSGNKNILYTIYEILLFFVPVFLLFGMRRTLSFWDGIFFIFLYIFSASLYVFILETRFLVLTLYLLNLEFVKILSNRTSKIKIYIKHIYSFFLLPIILFKTRVLFDYITLDFITFPISLSSKNILDFLK